MAYPSQPGIVVLHSLLIGFGVLAIVLGVANAVLQRVILSLQLAQLLHRILVLPLVVISSCPLVRCPGSEKNKGID